ELGVSPESLRGWCKLAKADRGEGVSGGLTTAVREELERLRKQSVEQARTIEVLRKPQSSSRRRACAESGGRSTANGSSESCESAASSAIPGANVGV
ncbi:hypothetical protein ACFYW6_39450, partial [Streptomyces sp. NPDC002659]